MNKARFIAQLEQKARRDRFSLFADLLVGVDRPVAILDIGGTYEYWKELDYTILGDIEIVLLNVFPQKDVPRPFTAVVGDGRELSGYSDWEFDLAFSNSVIGHVRTFADQELMAKGIRRVGRRYFVQTPNLWFPVDWRTLVPFFHFLPVSSQAWFIRHFTVGTYPRVRGRARSLDLAGRVRNLTRRELTILFPGATIVSERFFGLKKSFMVHNMGAGKTESRSNANSID